MGSQQKRADVEYPPTRRVEQVDTYHGREVADPYRWLEDDVRESDDVAAWVAAQNERAQTDPRRHLDLTGMPMPGEGSRRSLSASLQEMMPGLSVMLLSLALAMVIAVRRFSRYPLN